MATYAVKRCPKCSKLAHRCKCGEMNPKRSRRAPNILLEVTVGRLLAIDLGAIPSAVPEKNVGGRKTAWEAGRKEVFDYFRKELSDALVPPGPVAASKS